MPENSTCSCSNNARIQVEEYKNYVGGRSDDGGFCYGTSNHSHKWLFAKGMELQLTRSSVRSFFHFGFGISLSIPLLFIEEESSIKLSKTETDKKVCSWGMKLACAHTFSRNDICKTEKNMIVIVKKIITCIIFPSVYYFLPCDFRSVYSMGENAFPKRFEISGFILLYVTPVCVSITLFLV